jgi:ssRNA-specific RNase YbeY (16S rRNA maturation enzyme)
MIDTLPFSSSPVLHLSPLTLAVLTEPSLDNPQLVSVLKAVTQQFERAWPYFWQRIQQEPFLADAQIDPDKPWEADMVFVGNATCHAINRDYRHKDTPTDVITFTLYADDPNRAMLAQLPIHHLGSVLVNVDWAFLHALPDKALTLNELEGSVLQNETDWGVRGNLTPTHTFIMYILERMLHGCLHLLGVTHDTDMDYTRVVEIQHYVLDAIL